MPPQHCRQAEWHGLLGNCRHLQLSSQWALSLPSFWASCLQQATWLQLHSTAAFETKHKTIGAVYSCAYDIIAACMLHKRSQEDKLFTVHRQVTDCEPAQTQPHTWCADIEGNGLSGVHSGKIQHETC